jgi:hypothetical protein
VQELTFETQYLSAISLVTAILLGNTFAFSFDRQRQIICEMSEEIFALELLLQELFMEIHEPHLRWRVIKHIKCAICNCVTAVLHLIALQGSVGNVPGPHRLEPVGLDCTSSSRSVPLQIGLNAWP